MLPPHERDGSYTYDDYRGWSDGQRWELLAGAAHCMTPAPSTRHQEVVGRLLVALDAALRACGCRVFVAPIDVVLSDDTVVQPDLVVVCDQAQITEAHIAGAPRVVIEVLSPSTAQRDRQEKRAIYERFGVAEYLLVDPEDATIESYVRTGAGGFGESQVVIAPQILVLRTVSGAALDVTWLKERRSY